MTKQTAIVGFLATTKANEARRFFRDQLALPLQYEDEFALVFETGGTTLRVQKVASVSPPPHTSFGWAVSDIAEDVDQLLNKGVVFRRYPGMDQDARGIWTAPSGARIAWFNDPDGHVLSLTQL